MSTLPVADGAHLLGIHPKTLHHWLKEANVPLAFHPTDARIKCVTEEHLQQVATLHGRPLPSAGSLNAATLAPAPPQAHTCHLPENEASAASTACLLPPASAAEADLIQKVTYLETRVGTLQEQLTQLALALLQERERSVEQRITALEFLVQSRGARPMPDPFVPEAGQKSPSVLPKGRQLLPVEQLSRSRMPPLIEYSAQGTYVMISSQEGELHLVPDSAEWFEWLATISSFRFIGPTGRFSACRESRQSRGWIAHRCLHYRRFKRSIGVTDRLTITVWEQTAATMLTPADSV